MPRRFVIVLVVPLLMLAFPNMVDGQERLAGQWRGAWLRAGDSLPVTLTVRQDSADRYLATFDSDALRVNGIPFQQVSVDGCCNVSLMLRGDQSTLEFKGTLRGDSLTGAFREGKTDGRFVFARETVVPPVYDERDISFQSGDATLSGTLVLPRMQGRVPAIVFLHGSGAEGRWASRYLALQAAKRGIASLIFDKRGVGSSSGDWRVATPDILVADAVAAVTLLMKEPRIDATRIGIHGHSQGGTLAPMVAARSGHVAFVVASAGAGLPMDSVEMYSVLNSILPRATSAADSASASRYVGEMVRVAYWRQSRDQLDSLASTFVNRPWFFAPPPPDNAYWTFSPSYARYDPLHWWSQVRVPVLLVYGAEDKRVPAAESARRIEATLHKAGNTRVTTRILPGADHTLRLRAGPGGWSSSAPDYIPAVMEWLSRR